MNGHKLPDHKSLGTAMDLFHFQDEAAGMPFWHANGWTLYRMIQEYMRKRQHASGYKEVNTPQLASMALWERSGHADKFRENMYSVNVEDSRGFAIKPMNCPCHVQIFNSRVRSYRDLPLRMAEFGCCHRAEPSGALNGLFRGRAFVQDDAHIFCTEEKVVGETESFCKMLDSVYKDFGFDSYKVKFADRPEVRAGSGSIWDRSEAALLSAMEAAGLEYEKNEGEGAFYGPKIEFVLVDSQGRDWQCGTLQLDFILPERLGAKYSTQDGGVGTPVLIHRAVLGSFERFIGILLEHYSGDLPLWLAPEQVAVCPISDKNNSYANEISTFMREKGIRVKDDFRSTTLQNKIRENGNAKVPILCVIGNKEQSAKTFSLKFTKTGETRDGNMVELLDELLERVSPPF